LSQTRSPLCLIKLDCRFRLSPALKKRLQRQAARVLAGEWLEKVREKGEGGGRGEGDRKSVNLVFVDGKKIRALNKKFRKIDKITDVLSFEGEIVICVEQAQKNARRFGVTFEAEVLRLLTHGILHLAGYDHVKTGERVVMRKKEESYAQKIC